MLEPVRGISHEGAYRIAAVLRELFGNETQTSIASTLSQYGFTTDQTKVSAWMRGRVPNIEQLNSIEDCYGKPHGWVLARAGFVDVQALVREVRDLPMAAKGRRGRAATTERVAKRPSPRHSG